MSAVDAVLAAADPTSAPTPAGNGRPVPTSSLEAGDGPRMFRTYRVADLRAMDLTVRWLVRGVLVHPTYGMAAGEMKSLKSTLVELLAISVASGRPYLGRFDVDTPGPVLVYAGEGGRIPWTRRFERLARAAGVEDPDTLPLHVSFDVAPIGSDVFRESLERDLDEIQPVLFVLDPYYTFHGAGTDSRNLHEEGHLLAGMSAPLMDRGVTLLVVNHYNQTGSGQGLRRITQAGGGEWCDSWLLVAHRQDPDLDAGAFRLGLEIGSRQWGGTTWQVDIDLGAFDVDANEHRGHITWRIDRHLRTGTDPAGKAAEFVAGAPGAYSKEDLARAIGGNRQAARAAVDLAERRGDIHPRLVTVTDTRGRKRKVWRYSPGPPPAPSSPRQDVQPSDAVSTTLRGASDAQTSTDAESSASP